jgi:lysophospholipid acyltransferase (LPLAT)-like uncharacterized protein
MNLAKRINNSFLRIFGRPLLWLWGKTARIAVIGEEEYRKLRALRRPVVLLIWHGRIFLAPYFFRRTGIMPLISPSRDGEVLVQLVASWGYKILRGSGSHSIVRAWSEMKKELESGGVVVIVPDGPKGPDRVLKLGCLRLAQETGALLVPFTFSASWKKHLKSWDKFLLFYPFSRVVAMFDGPSAVDPGLKGDALERERQRIEHIMISLDQKADAFFVKTRGLT